MDNYYNTLNIIEFLLQNKIRICITLSEQSAVRNVLIYELNDGCIKSTSMLVLKYTRNRDLH